AEHADAVGVGLGESAGLIGVLRRARQRSAAFILLYLDRNLGLRDRGLLLGARFGFAQFAFFLRRQALALIGADLFVGNLALTQLGQNALDLVVALGAWPRRADQHFLQFEVIGVELLLHVLRGSGLDLAALLQEFDERAALGDVLEVGRDHRV